MNTAITGPKAFSVFLQSAQEQCIKYWKSIFCKHAACWEKVKPRASVCYMRVLQYTAFCTWQRRMELCVSGWSLTVTHCFVSGVKKQIFKSQTIPASDPKRERGSACALQSQKCAACRESSLFIGKNCSCTCPGSINRHLRDYGGNFLFI